jgi:DnaJ-class molecular chaperone
MFDPYRTLGVARNAGDGDIHSAWLRLIRQYPPERDPHRFKLAQRAFELLQDRHSRLAFELFDSEPPELDELLDMALSRAEARRPEVDKLRQCLSRSVCLARASLPTADD